MLKEDKIPMRNRTGGILSNVNGNNLTHQSNAILSTAEVDVHGKQMIRIIGN
jgi:hypothetical protein